MYRSVRAGVRRWQFSRRSCSCERPRINPGLAATNCESLASLALPNTTITRQTVPRAAHAARRAAATAGDAATLCRVLPRRGDVEAVQRLDIKIEVWLPAANWNGKLRRSGTAPSNATAMPP
jgi:hypothetical protein